jgi:hypothetical protein
MWGRQRKVDDLHEELLTIAVFDRVYDYNTDPNRGNDGAYASRQTRRAEILSEIAKLEAKRWFEVHAGTASLMLSLCAAAYATFHLLK